MWLFAPLAFVAWSLTAGGPWAAYKEAAVVGSVCIVLLSALIFPLVSMALARAAR